MVEVEVFAAEEASVVGNRSDKRRSHQCSKDSISPVPMCRT